MYCPHHVHDDVGDAFCKNGSMRAVWHEECQQTVLAKGVDCCNRAECLVWGGWEVAFTCMSHDVMGPITVLAQKLKILLRIILDGN